MKVNVAKKVPVQHTAEGAVAASITAEQRLRRLVACCMLWEDGFYMDGKTVADEISDLVGRVSPEFAAAVAYEARTRQKLRHAPLLVVREMARLPRHKALVSRLLPDVIQRADEITEFLAIYWKGGRQPLSAAVKKGLATAFLKFDEYQLAKYDRVNAAVRLRDALFLCHAKPDSKEREDLWKRLITGQLATPDTWEVSLSGGADKAQTFMRLMEERKLGAMAFLRNLRNMNESSVPRSAVHAYAQTINVGRVLPFRFLAAARAVPRWEDIIEPVMMRAIEGRPRMAGRTAVLVDVSGSMDNRISMKSDITRLDAACGVAILAREIATECEVYSFSQHLVAVPPRRGFALRDAIVKSQVHAGTYLGIALEGLKTGGPFDRVIVITDEQTAARIGSPPSKLTYVVNVASNRNGVGYGEYRHIDGWSEAVIDYIQESERIEAQA